ncbi:MAG: hypothetical protein ACRD2S_08225 [Terriglobales bacterium]
MKLMRTVFIYSILLLSAASVSLAQQLYFTNEPQKELEQVDLGNGVTTVLYNIGAEPDDLILDSQGRLIYSVPSSGIIYRFDPATKTNSVLITGLKYARDMVIEPGGNSMLISVYALGEIVRFNFDTGTTTILSKKLGTADGLAYDDAGHLFAVANHNTIVQIDPASGAILKTLVLEAHSGTNGGDGMTFDSYTGHLWICHDERGAGGLIEVPTDLSSFTFYQTGKMNYPDGIKSDGKGNLYIGSLWVVLEYNIPSDQITKSIVVKGADGVALVPGTTGTGAPSGQLYFTNEPQKELERLDLDNGVTDVLYNIGAEPDDLIVDSQGQLIYSVPSSGTIYRFDPVTGNNSVLVSGLKYARDLLIEPGGNSMLISVYALGEIARFNLITGTTTILTKKLGTADGLAYDDAGHLFAIANHNTVAQIDPVSGAVLKTLVLEPHSGTNGGDGMTFDSYTGHSWISHDERGAGGLIEVPTDLSSSTLYQTGKMNYPDGIKSDGKGNLYIGSLWVALEYNIPSDEITKSFVVKGADGVALVPGTY